MPGWTGRALPSILARVSALFLAGFGLGVVVAAQIGPVTLLIVRSVLRGGRALAVGLAMAGAVALVDLAYATLGLAGIGRLLEGGPARLVLGLTSAAILVTLGLRTAWLGLRARGGLETGQDVVLPTRAFVTAVAATATNPLTVALWLVSFPAAAPAAAAASVQGAVAVLVGVGLGSLTWYCGFAAAIALAGKRIGDRLLAAVDVVVGCGLVAFGALTGARTLRET
jgi:threonine/homoserine/homoserine lactone efflux protein